MSENYALKAATRSGLGRKAAKKDRLNNSIPAVLYGHGIPTQPLMLNQLDFVRIFRSAGESTLIDLSVDAGESVKVLIHSIQQDPLKDTISHVDFYQVRMDEELTAEVELVFIGEAPAVKDLGGTLVKNFSNIEIQCLPKDLLHNIEIDISALASFDDLIRVKDIKLPAGVVSLTDSEGVIAAVSAPRTAEELAALEEEVVENVEDVAVGDKPAAAEAEGVEAEGDKKPSAKEGK